MSETKELIEAYFTPNPSLKAYDSIIFIIKDGKVFRMGNDEGAGVWIDECETNEGDGSGCKFAVAAMDFGRSAYGALKYAMEKDFYTGGKIQVIDCSTGEFRDVAEKIQNDA